MTARRKVIGSLDPVKRVPLSGPLNGMESYIPSRSHRSDPFVAAESLKFRQEFAESVLRKWPRMACSGCGMLPDVEEILDAVERPRGASEIAGHGRFACRSCRGRA